MALSGNPVRASRQRGSVAPAFRLTKPCTTDLPIGLDWFLLDLFLMAVIYVPLERLWPQYPRTRHVPESVDFGHRLFHVHAFSAANFIVFGFAARHASHEISGHPGPSEFDRAVALDLAIFPGRLWSPTSPNISSTWLSTKFRFSWRFHAIHHSSKALDWIAGSRSHFVDDTLVRGFILFPLMFGFSQWIIFAYLIFVTLHATWTHCNFGPNAKWLEKFLVMPRYHHWHHTSQKEGIDKNFAIHFPWIDKIFGTYYFPENVAGAVRTGRRRVLAQLSSARRSKPSEKKTGA